MFWDFISLRPETSHQVSFLFSSRGTPDGYRHMNGYGSHTFKMVNSNNEAVYCKFHLKVISFIFILVLSWRKSSHESHCRIKYMTSAIFNWIRYGIHLERPELGKQLEEDHEKQ